jgi:hypothetical protein
MSGISEINKANEAAARKAAKATTEKRDGFPSASEQLADQARVRKLAGIAA